MRRPFIRIIRVSVHIGFLAAFLWNAPAAVAQSLSPATKSLFDAVWADDMSKVKSSLAAGADMSAINDLGVRPVDMAVDKGHYDIAHYLLSVEMVRRQSAAQKQQPTPSQRVAARAVQPAPVASSTGSGWLSGNTGMVSRQPAPQPAPVSRTAPPAPVPAAVPPTAAPPAEEKLWTPGAETRVAETPALKVVSVAKPRVLPKAPPAPRTGTAVAPAAQAPQTKPTHLGAETDQPTGWLDKVTSVFKSSPQPTAIEAAKTAPTSEPALRPTEAAAPENADDAPGWLDKVSGIFESSPAPRNEVAAVPSPPSPPTAPVQPAAAPKPVTVTAPAETAAVADPPVNVAEKPQPQEDLLTKLGDLFKSDSPKAPEVGSGPAAVQESEAPDVPVRAPEVNPAAAEQQYVAPEVTTPPEPAISAPAASDPAPALADSKASDADGPNLFDRLAKAFQPAEPTVGTAAEPAKAPLPPEPAATSTPPAPATPKPVVAEAAPEPVLEPAPEQAPEPAAVAETPAPETEGPGLLNRLADLFQPAEAQTDAVAASSPPPPVNAPVKEIVVEAPAPAKAPAQTAAEPAAQKPVTEPVATPDSLTGTPETASEQPGLLSRLADVFRPAEPAVVDSPVETAAAPVVVEEPVEAAAESAVNEPPVEAAAESVVKEPPVETAAEPAILEPPVEAAAAQPANEPPVETAAEPAVVEPPVEAAAAPPTVEIPAETAAGPAASNPAADSVPKDTALAETPTKVSQEPSLLSRLADVFRAADPAPEAVGSATRETPPVTETATTPLPEAAPVAADEVPAAKFAAEPAAAAKAEPDAVSRPPSAQPETAAGAPSPDEGPGWLDRVANLFGGSDETELAQRPAERPAPGTAPVKLPRGAVRKVAAPPEDRPPAELKIAARPKPELPASIPAPSLVPSRPPSPAPSPAPQPETVKTPDPQPTQPMTTALPVRPQIPRPSAPVGTPAKPAAQIASVPTGPDTGGTRRVLSPDNTRASRNPANPPAPLGAAAPLNGVTFRLAPTAGLGGHLSATQSGQCIDKSRWNTMYCIEPIAWPDAIASAFQVNTSFYRGKRAIVEYVAGKAEQYHIMFPVKEMRRVVDHFKARYGEPTEMPEIWTALIGQPKRHNRTLRWRSRDAKSGAETVLEIREIDDLRWSSPPDVNHGVLRLYAKDRGSVFELLSSTDLLLVQLRRRR